MIKKYCWLVLLLVIIVLVGCKPKPADKSNIFNETYDNMINQTNFKVELTINTGYGENIKTKAMVFGFDLDTNNLGIVKVDTTLMEVEFEGYREFTDTEVISYTSIPGTGNWVRNVITKADFSKQDIDNENYFTILTNLTQDHYVKDETIEGSKYAVYTVKLNKPEILDDIFTKSKQENLMLTYNLTEAKFKDYFKEVTFVVKIDTNKKLVKCINADLREIFTKMAADYQETNGKAPAEVFSEVSLDIVFSDYNKVKVSIPANVKETMFNK